MADLQALAPGQDVDVALINGAEEIDPKKLFESLQAARNDIATYVRSVETYVEHLSASQ